MKKINKIRINGNEYSIVGESAYDIAVRNGYDGTEEEWLESLRGENGDDGEDASGCPDVTEADEGKFLQANDGSWIASEFLRILDGVLYLGDIAFSQKGLQTLISLADLKAVSGVYNIGGCDSDISGEISGITFTSNGESFTRMCVTSEFDDAVGYRFYLYYDDKLVAETYNVGDFYFTDDGYMSVDFGTDEQELTSEEYALFNSIAIKQVTISGVYQFSSNIYIPYDMDVSVSFTSFDMPFSRLVGRGQQDGLYYDDLRVVRTVEDMLTGDSIVRWEGDAYRTVNFGVTEQTVSEDFYNWLTNNATKI